MKTSLRIDRLISGLLWGLVIYGGSLQAKPQELESLEAILTDLATYEFGDPTPWKSELLKSMQTIYQETDNQSTAIQLINYFLNSDASEEAKRVVQKELRALESLPPKTVSSKDMLDEVDSLMIQPKDWPGKNEALLTIAERMLDLGENTEALKLYNHLSSDSSDIMIQVAALNGKFHASERPISILKTALNDSNSTLRRQAIRLVKDLPPEFSNGAQLFKVAPLTDIEEAQLLIFLAERGDASVHSLAVEYLKGANPVLRSAALYVFELLGQADDVLGLTKLASQEIETESDLARKALYRMPGQAIDKQIVTLLDQSPTDVQIELIKAIEERNLTSASNELLDLVRSSSNQKVASESLQAIAMTAPIETLEPLVDLLRDEPDSKVQKNIERSISRIVSRFPDDPIGQGILKQIESQSN